MSFHRENEPESPALLNRVLAQARRTELRRKQQLSSKELLATSRLELGIIGPKVLSQSVGSTYQRQP